MTKPDLHRKVEIITPDRHKLFVEIYPVGILHEIENSWRSRAWRMNLMNIPHYIRWREWRHLKNYFNGYLAEPDVMPGNLRRCGSGWTRKRALRDLKRRVRRILW